MAIFPGVVLSIELGGRTGSKLAEEITAGRAPRVLVVPVGNDDEDVNGALGVEVEVKQISKTRRGGGAVVILRGLARRRLVTPLQLDPFLTAEVEPVDEIAGEGPEIDALVRALRDGVVQLMQRSEAPDADIREIEAIDSPSVLADRVAAYAGFPPAEALAILTELDVPTRLRRVRAALELRLAAMAKASEMTPDKGLREAVLREKMAQIQKELGEDPDRGAGAADEWRQKIAEAKLPPEVEAVAKREARRLGTIDGGSPEQTVARTYLEWLIELPWSKRSESEIDLAAARRILDEDHQGLKKVKQRIVEYLAVRKLNPAKKGPILLLVGPPGVGKTSLGRSIARALGRQYVRMSLGGVRDEAEIRGHRRTYIGALPGRIMQGLKRAGTRNPVFVLDEIDKLGSDRGDPSSALLEVLDPEQNFSFSDHYVELPFDLSEVVFIATANDLGTIPAPLRDRMEVLSLSGYTTAEKRGIAANHLVPRQLAEHGLNAEHMSFTPGALDEIIEGYTREPGVRNLEREIAQVVRGIAVKVAAGEAFATEIGAADLPGILGPTRFFSDAAERDGMRPGVATGLAWTPAGGEIMFVETTLMPGKGKMVMTGQLGDVMNESAQAAMSYVRSHAAELGIAPGRFEKSDVHLHFPAGGVPKDGPSAGNAITTALVSLFTERPVRGDVAMTGEITLRGHVLPVGGITSKVLAAHRAGIKRVILPARNAKDLEEIPLEVREAIEIHLVSRLPETLELSLLPAEVATAAAVIAANANLPSPAPTHLAA